MTRPSIRFILFATILATTSVVLAGVPTGAATPAAYGRPPGKRVVLRAAGRGPRVFVPPPPPSRLSAGAPATAATAPAATVVVNYTGFSAPARAAFQAAVDIWKRTLSSRVPIVIDAAFKPLEPDALGAAQPTELFDDRAAPGLPPRVWYPAALGNAIQGSDVDPTASDITAEFNSAVSEWYFGTDGDTPPDRYDFETAVLHELTHGLGFTGSFDFDTATGRGLWGVDSPPELMPFDPFVVNGSAQRLIDFANPSSTLGNQERSGSVFFAGPKAAAANGGAPVRLYAPNPWEPGSSIYHTDPSAFPSGAFNSLMDPGLGTGTAVHDPGPVVVGMMQDEGWVAAGTPRPPMRPADFNGDGTTDVSVFRPTGGAWFPQGGATTLFGASGDVPVPADYDGDGRTDVAVYRPSSGTWFVSGGAATAFGTSGDVPVPGDYDGDGKADLAVYRPSSGTWFVRGVATAQWGTTGDVPVPGDYNGDGRTDVAVYRPSSGTWFVSGGAATRWGTSGDVPVPGDYNGDGRTDVAVFRPSSGTWFVSGGATTRWGTSGDVPLAGDYDGDGRTDLAVLRPSSGFWFVATGVTTRWGTSGDIPLPIPAAIRMRFFGP